MKELIWHPINSRPMTDEERQYWEDHYGYALDDDEAIIYSNLPDSDEQVICCDIYGAITIDRIVDDGEGCYFEDNGEMDGIVAWMPLPEPYKEDDDEVIK